MEKAHLPESLARGAREYLVSTGIFGHVYGEGAADKGKGKGKGASGKNKGKGKAPAAAAPAAAATEKYR